MLELPSPRVWRAAAQTPAPLSLSRVTREVSRVCAKGKGADGEGRNGGLGRNNNPKKKKEAKSGRPNRVLLGLASSTPVSVLIHQPDLLFPGFR